MMASWIFGAALLIFLGGIVVWRPVLDTIGQRIVAFFCALLAGFFAFFFTGSLAVNIVGQAITYGNLGVQAGGGLAAFALMLWWFLSPWAPIKQDIPPIKRIIVKRPSDDIPQSK